MHEEEKMDQEVEIDLSDEDIENEDIIEISPEDPLRSQLDEECEKSNNLFEKLQRLQAEFDNYRKRMDARFSDVAKFASEDILLKVIDVYDNLMRALEMDFAKDPEAAKDGIHAIQQQFEKMLTLEGVRPIESVGKEFDPYYQHAVQRVYDKEKPDGVILEEFQRGYMLKEKVLRPAVVCVNRHEDSTVEVSNDDDNNNDSENNGE
ncbi:MAG: nucleotide exchange factor GrpE [Candidatus Thorarchaeota archaeon]|jgi:molecular chaperone GrpE